MIDTRQKILDTAERLFATRGYTGVSLRQIIAAAEVNLAAVHYHFGSKQELLDEVIMRRAAPVNRERLARLERLEAQSGAQAPQVEEVLEAFLMPMAEAAENHPEFPKLMGRMQAEGILTEVVARNFQPMLAIFMGALRKAVPDLPDSDFVWRVHFAQGCIAHAMSSDPMAFARVEDIGGFPGRIERLIAFLSGAFRAPAGIAGKPAMKLGKGK